jgi:hypothetical protein
MPPDSFLHERSDFKALVATVAEGEKINDPALVRNILRFGAGFLDDSIETFCHGSSCLVPQNLKTSVISRRAMVRRFREM